MNDVDRNRRNVSTQKLHQRGGVERKRGSFSLRATIKRIYKTRYWITPKDSTWVWSDHNWSHSLVLAKLGPLLIFFIFMAAIIGYWLCRDTLVKHWIFNSLRVHEVSINFYGNARSGLQWVSVHEHAQPAWSLIMSLNQSSQGFSNAEHFR